MSSPLNSSANDLRSASEQTLISLIKSAPVGIYRTDALGNCHYVNDRWCQIAGLTLTEAEGFGWVNGIHPSDRDLVAKEWNAAIQEKRPFQLEYRLQNHAGEITWAYGQAVSEPNETGEIIGYIGTITDISDRKQSEAALKQLNQELEAKVEERTLALWQVNSMQRAILDGADYAFISTDLNGIIQTFNDAAERMLGYSAGEVIGNVSPTIIHEPQEIIDKATILSVELDRDIPIGFEVLVAKARLGITSEDEWTYIRKDGSRFPVLLSVTALMDVDRQIIGFLGIAQDISDRKLSEEKLRKSDIHLKTAQRIGKLGSWEFDPYTEQIIWSDEVFRIFGRDPAMGTPSFDELQEQIHPDDRAHHQQVVQTAIATIQPYDLEVRFYRIDGSFGYFFAKGEPIVDATGQLTQLIGTILDITDRKQAEEQLKNLSDRLTLAMKSGNIGIWDWNVTENILTWDDRMYELYGITPDRFTSVYDAWASSLHPEDRLITETAVQKALTGEKDYDPEFRVIHSDGTIRFIRAYAFVQRDAHGEAIRMIGLNIDNTNQKRAEAKLRETSAQLAASNRELEAFAYSVSHDLRSPLRAIDGFSKALLEDYGDKFDADAKDYFDRIRSNVARMGTLIEDLLSLSRVSRTEIEYRNVNLSKLVQEQLDELQITDPERQVEIAIAPNVWVSADATLMRVVINNLIQNAWKFTSHHPTALIEFGMLDLESRGEDRQFTYFVRDDGSGFDMNYVKKLFGVFQRLHNTNEFTGTGIGLATVQRAIHRHGGRVWAEAAVEKGATIYFTLPNSSSQELK
jgi:PAS domain S-box-containing protein